jgi:hypothetical protein
MASQITRDEFIKFVEARGVKGLCEVCGKNKGWVVPDDGQGRTVGLINARADNLLNILGDAIPATIMVCDNCGHMRLFSEVYVANLLKKEDADAK